MRKAFAVLVVLCMCVAPAAIAADDGNTQPKVNSASNNSSTTATDLIATTNGSGNVKGVACGLNQDGYNRFPHALVKFYVNGGTAQSVTITGEQHPAHGDPGYQIANTGWVPFNVRFTTSIRVTIQKASSTGASIDCAVSWGLD